MTSAVIWRLLPPDLLGSCLVIHDDQAEESENSGQFILHIGAIRKIRIAEIEAIFLTVVYLQNGIGHFDWSNKHFGLDERLFRIIISQSFKKFMRNLPNR